MKRKLIKSFFWGILFLIITNCFCSSVVFALKIADYQPTFIPVYYPGGNKMGLAIRNFSLDSVPYFLVVDPETFATTIAPIKRFTTYHSSYLRKEKFYNQLNKIGGTRYFRALQKYTNLQPHALQNDGINSSAISVPGVFLTIDLCPSSHYFAKTFFATLIEIAKKQCHPLPLAIAVSGLWIKKHQQEFAWLVEQQRQQHFAITWVNHSYSHVYYSALPVEENFFLNSHAPNFAQEILATEKILLEMRQLPSVFFRFPGLVSNAQLQKTLYRLSLIPLGSNAWLAKGERVRNGSIILVHGNGNEPAGIKRFNEYLTQNSHLNFLPLEQLFQ